MDGCGVVFILLVITAVVAGLITSNSIGRKKPEDDALKAKFRTALNEGDLENVKAAVAALAKRLREPDYSGAKKTDANDVYQQILAALKAHPTLRPLALELGRLAYGIGRPKDTPTVYDEAAIANDIAAHS